MTFKPGRAFRFFILSLFCTHVLHAQATISPELLQSMWEGEYRRLEEEIAEYPLWYGTMDTSDVANMHAVIRSDDRHPLDVLLRRTKALFLAIDSIDSDHGIDSLYLKVQAIEKLVDTVSPELRKELFFETCRLRRAIAFGNPLLDFTDIVFVEKVRTEVSDITRQYGGAHAQAGGGLYLLRDAFGESPRKVDLTADAGVWDGARNDEKLAGGAFAAPELSFDGDTVYFSWCARPGSPWSADDEDGKFHIYCVDSAGKMIHPLTDGSSNDMDPCVLPNGRIAFISERNTGFCRGFDDPVPVHSLFSMKADGSDILRLSYHLSHEWKPCVDNNGQIVYTRWDNIDRDRFCGMHLWACYPDGRDPRALSGNYPHPYTTLRYLPEWLSYTPMVKGGAQDGRRFRPMCYMDIHAIPGCASYTATAAPIHGPEKGTLVLINPRVEDDGAQAQIKRINPHVPFPESETGVDLPTRESVCLYGFACPLSEEFFLCVYCKTISLVDCFGNTEIVYTSPEGFLPADPIPLRSRPRPPVFANRVYEGEEGGNSVPRRATVAVVNVYLTSPFAFPDSIVENAEAKWLRVVALHADSSSAGDQSPIDYGHEGIARKVLGVVPVEKDGSANFHAPLHTPLLFQLLDENHMAIHSMRSATYLHEGEQLICLGCHESKWEAVPPPESIPLAFDREPSDIEPEIEDHGKPFDFTNLVEPVFTTTCLPCHHDTGRGLMTMTYESLRHYAFYYDNGENTLTQPDHGGSRSVPGGVGAHASVMGKRLLKSHLPRLTDEEWNRVMLWLDNNSPGSSADRVGAGDRIADSRPQPHRSSAVLSIDGGHVETVNTTSAPARLSLFSFDGRLVRTRLVAPRTTAVHAHFLSGDLPAGAFVVRYTTANRSFSARVTPAR